MITWLFPECCPVCLKIVSPRGAVLHKECEKRLRPIKAPICNQCGKPLAMEGISECCGECAAREVQWESGRCLYSYHSAIQGALIRVKKYGIKEFVYFFAKELAENYQLYLSTIQADCIVPVPMHRQKQNGKGFNHAELIAKELGQFIGLPVTNLLYKKVKTREQKSLSKEQRKRNLSHAFCMNQKEVEAQRIPKTVLLVDDIYTTGSTINACATVLKQHGVNRVYFLCVCNNSENNIEEKE